MKKILTFLETSDPAIIWPIIISSVSLILVAGTFFLFYNRLPPNLPLLYSLPWGQTQLVPKQQFLILPVTLFLITLVNTFITFRLNAASFVLKKMLMLSVITMDLIVIITTIKIISIFI